MKVPVILFVALLWAAMLSLAFERSLFTLRAADPAFAPLFQLPPIIIRP